MSSEKKEKARVLISCPSMRGVLETLALDAAGYDVTFATSLCFSELGWLPQLGPLRSIRNLFAKRLYPDLAPIDVRRIWLPEATLKALMYVPFGSSDRKYRIHNELFDRMVLPLIANYDVFHFVNGIGMFSAQRAKSKGLQVVLSQRAAHPLFERSLLQQEAERFGVRFAYYADAYLDRVLREFELADSIIVQSEYAARTLAEHGLLDKIRVVNLSFNARVFDRPSTEISSVFRVIYAGAITLHKGVHYLVEGFRKACLPDAELLLVGTPDDNLRPLIHNLDTQVHHSPHVSRTKLRELYTSASVLVLPSLSDAWGFVVLEAMATGLPVIVTENTGAKDAVRPDVDGFIVPIRDSDAIADKLRLLYENRDLCCHMGQNAAQHAQQFAWEPYFERFEMTYGHILGHK